MLRALRRSGATPSTYPHMAAGWAVCLRFALHLDQAGRVELRRHAATSMVVHWPNGIKAKGELRTQWHHVIDVVPTILEAAGLPQPRVVDGSRRSVRSRA